MQQNDDKRHRARTWEYNADIGCLGATNSGCIGASKSGCTEDRSIGAQPYGQPDGRNTGSNQVYTVQTIWAYRYRVSHFRSKRCQKTGIGGRLGPIIDTKK